MSHSSSSNSESDLDYYIRGRIAARHRVNSPEVDSDDNGIVPQSPTASSDLRSSESTEQLDDNDYIPTTGNTDRPIALAEFLQRADDLFTSVRDSNSSDQSITEYVECVLGGRIEGQSIYVRVDDLLMRHLSSREFRVVRDYDSLIGITKTLKLRTALMWAPTGQDIVALKSTLGIKYKVVCSSLYAQCDCK